MVTLIPLGNLKGADGGSVDDTSLAPLIAEPLTKAAIDMTAAELLDDTESDLSHGVTANKRALDATDTADEDSALRQGLDPVIVETVTDAAPTLLAPTYTTMRGAGVAVIGDSIAAYNSATGNAWHKVFATLSRKTRWRGVFATGGATLQSIQAIHLPQALALNPKPGALVLAGGTNDVGSVGYVPAGSKATLLEMIADTQEAGVVPILWTLPPRNDSATVNAHLQRWNAWVRYLAQSKGLQIIDAYAALVDPATGLAPVAYYLPGDGTHPNPEGHLRIGRRAALDLGLLALLRDDTPHLVRDVLDAANLIPTGRGLFNQGVNGAGVPTGWAGYGLAAGVNVPSQSASADPVVGNWQTLTKPAGSSTGGGGLQYNITTGFAAGDRVAYAVRVKSASPDDSTHGAPAISLQARKAGAILTGVPTGGFGGTWEGIAWGELVVPAETDTLRFDLSLGATQSPAADVSASFAQATLVNLTALGL